MRYSSVFVLVFYICCKQVCYGQKETTLKGYLGVQGGEAYTYKLVFNDSAGFIKGYSYTYLYETKEVKAAITGFIDKTNRTLSFHETEIVYNHGFESNTTICLINATLKYKMGNDSKEIYSGPIVSSDVSNVYCGQGTVTFPFNEDLQRLLASAPAIKPAEQRPIAKPAKPVRVIYDTTSLLPKDVYTAKMPNNDVEKITAGKEKFIEWHSDSVIIEVWDGGKIDGDIISITYNSNIIISNLSLTSAPERRVVSMHNGEAVLKIVARNEGNEPPNTANLLLIDGAVRHPIVAYNIIGKEAVIRLRKSGK